MIKRNGEKTNTILKNPMVMKWKSKVYFPFSQKPNKFRNRKKEKQRS